MSHLSVLQDPFRFGYETVLVLEDDILVEKDPKYTIREPISEDIERIGSRIGAYSIIIRRSGIEKLLRFFGEHQIYLPYDLEYYIVPGIRLYGLRYNVVTNFLEAISDTGRFE